MFPFERLYILTLLEIYPCVMQNSARAIAEISNILRKGEMIVIQVGRISQKMTLTMIFPKFSKEMSVNIAFNLTNMCQELPICLHHMRYF